jgi:hypothetical protein
MSNEKSKSVSKCPDLSYHLSYLLGQNPSYQSFKEQGVVNHLGESFDDLCCYFMDIDSVTLRLNMFIKEFEELQKKYYELLKRKNDLIAEKFQKGRESVD